MDFRTDMAVERREIYKKAQRKEDIPGIECEEEIENEYIVNRVKIVNEDGEKALGKKQGDYITIDFKKFLTEKERDKLTNKISKEINLLLDKNSLKQGEILVVGLGNSMSTPDSLGSKVVQNIEITRHIKLYLPSAINPNIRSVAAINPGVLGTTGIESFEVINSIIQKIKPKGVIIIDSLCSKSIDRLNKSVQISDTGITPGAGVGNRRQELSKETLNLPVISIGIPTVVDAASLVLDTVQNLNIEIDEARFAKEMNVNNFNFVVTPKEIDELVSIAADILSDAINLSMNV